MRAQPVRPLTLVQRRHGPNRSYGQPSFRGEATP